MSGSAHPAAGGSKSWFGTFDGHTFKMNLGSFTWPLIIIGAVIVGLFVIIIVAHNIHGSSYSSLPLTTATTTSPLASSCDYSHRRLELSSESVVFNPGARCAYNFTVKEGAVEFDGPDGTETAQADQPVVLHSWMETARAVNGHAVLLYQLFPAQ